MSAPDPDVNVVMNPIDLDRGTLICIEKDRAPGSRFTTYQIRAGRLESPIRVLLEQMEESEREVFRPIEQTIRRLSDDEQWEHLGRVVGRDVAAEIRSSVA
ncbi:hypothetical protein [Haloferula sp.]|uniref:hypothetical protein n=1 Tax=Haloferula sp. TaxID=2497595 RepID=UPI003C7236DA